MATERPMATVNRLSKRSMTILGCCVSCIQPRFGRALGQSQEREHVNLSQLSRFSDFEHHQRCGRCGRHVEVGKLGVSRQAHQRVDGFLGLLPQALAFSPSTKTRRLRGGTKMSSAPSDPSRPMSTAPVSASMFSASARFVTAPRADGPRLQQLRGRASLSRTGHFGPS